MAVTEARDARDYATHSNLAQHYLHAGN